MRSSEVTEWTGSVPVATTPRYKRSRAWKWGQQSWLGELSRGSRKFGREISAWLSCKPVRFPEAGELATSIASLCSCGLDTAASEIEDEEAPIFLLSTGWRAGSTLLQRILITDQRLLLWGEPLGDMAVISRIAEMVSHSISPLKLRVWENQVDANSSALATSWIANLYPHSSYLRGGLRSLVAEWLAKPARDRGFARWGLKECRLGATEATLLHWLYPNAKFVIISRHPYDCYRSLADARWGPYYRYPDVRVNSAASFAHHWNRLATSWSALPSGFPCFSMKYEDLVCEKVDFRKLESFLGLEIKEDLALSACVGGTAKRDRLTWYERSIIGCEAAAGMRALGYSNQSAGVPRENTQPVRP